MDALTFRAFNANLMIFAFGVGGPIYRQSMQDMRQHGGQHSRHHKDSKGHSSAFCHQCNQHLYSRQNSGPADTAVRSNIHLIYQSQRALQSETSWFRVLTGAACHQGINSAHDSKLPLCQGSLAGSLCQRGKLLPEVGLPQTQEPSSKAGPAA